MRCYQRRDELKSKMGLDFGVKQAVKLLRDPNAKPRGKAAASQPVRTEKKAIQVGLTAGRVCDDKVCSVAVTRMVNGSGEAVYASIATLQAAFCGCGFTFKHCPESTNKFLRWQAGKTRLDAITMPNGETLLLERFELLSWSETAEGLIESLAGKD